MAKEGVKMNIRKLVAVPLVAGTLAMTAAPAFAATQYGSFPWKATIKVGLDSRKWDQIAGSTTITAKFPCWNDQVDHYSIEIYRNELIDDSYGKKSFACDTTVTKTWTGLKSGTYHFHISKTTDGISISGTGTVKYPSSS